MMDEPLRRLDKYRGFVDSRELRRHELMRSDQTSGLNIKMGTPTCRNPPDLVFQKTRDPTKSVILNKRVRTSVAETRGECNSEGIMRQTVAKDRDSLNDHVGHYCLVEEKMQRLPDGGEGWDKKMKRKRSMGLISARTVDHEGELKRAVRHKVNSDRGVQPCDARIFRSGSFNGNGSTSLLDSASSLATSSHLTPKYEQEGGFLSRDMAANKEKIPAKRSTKLNGHEDALAASPSPVSKIKASRTQRIGSIEGTSSPSVSGAPEGEEPAPGVGKIHLVGCDMSYKRTVSSGPSSPPVPQWAGQRAQNISRTKRANLNSQFSIHDEKLRSSSSSLMSNLGARLTSSESKGSLLSRNAAMSCQPLKFKLDKVQAPAKSSETEEPSACGNRSKSKGMMIEVAVHGFLNVEPSVEVGKKNIPLVNEDIGCIVLRQMRSVRGPSVSQSSCLATREKLNDATTKPHWSTQSISEKDGSKLGRHLKKLSDRKPFSRLGLEQAVRSPDCTGEPEEDRDELIAAANFTRKSIHLACSNSFWKRMEPIFAPVSLEDKFHLEQGDHLREVAFVSNTSDSGDINEQEHSQISSEESACPVEWTKQHGEATLLGVVSERRSNGVIPLYERVLSALIVVDDMEEPTKGNARHKTPLQNGICDSAKEICPFVNIEPGRRDGIEFECASYFTSISCDRRINAHKNSGAKSPGDTGRSEAELLSEVCINFLDRSQCFGISSFDCQHGQSCLDENILLELQSVGLFTKSVPDLEDEDERINIEINQLNIRLQQQSNERKMCVDKIQNACGSISSFRDLEQVAMDRLVELAHKKLLAVRGRAGVKKVPRHVALAFARRALARCHQFEVSGRSCFKDPPLHDIIFSSPSRDNGVDNGVEFASIGPTVSKKPLSHQLGRISGCPAGSSSPFGVFSQMSDKAFAKNGPISNRGKKKELFLYDVVDSASLQAQPQFFISATGKRSEKGKSSRNAIAKSEQNSITTSKVENRTKSKPKLKKGQAPTPGDSKASKLSEAFHPMHSSAKGSNDIDTQKLVNKNKDAEDISTFLVDDLEMGTNGNNDLVLLDFDGLQDHFSAGLEIPLDNLADVFC